MVFGVLWDLGGGKGATMHMRFQCTILIPEELRHIWSTTLMQEGRFSLSG